MSEENSMLKQQLDGVSAQLEAHKQLLTEQLNAALMFRSNIILFQKHIQELNEKLKTSEAQVVSLNQQLAEANAKLPQ